MKKSLLAVVLVLFAVVGTAAPKATSDLEVRIAKLESKVRVLENQNLVVNGSFEQGGFGWLSNGNVVFTTSAGVGVCLLQGTEFWIDSVSQAMPCQAGSQYELSFVSSGGAITEIVAGYGTNELIRLPVTAASNRVGRVTFVAPVSDGVLWFAIPGSEAVLLDDVSVRVK